jgi:hypothetical protein
LQFFALLSELDPQKHSALMTGYGPFAGETAAKIKTDIF